MSTKHVKAPPFKPLTIEQENAIDLLILGRSDREVAATVGVDRTTVWSWRAHHPLFGAELNRRRLDLFRAAQHRLLALVAKAIDNVEAAVAAGDVKASVELLKAVGVYGAPVPVGETDPEVILESWVDEAMAREGLEPDASPLAELLQKPPNPAYVARRVELRHLLGHPDE
jgi:hypothetical protein